MLKELTILLVFLAVTSAVAQFEEIFRWRVIDFAWPSEEIETKVFDRNEYIPINNAIAGIKVWKGRMYLTIPRWKAGIPVTLAVTSVQPVRDQTGRENWQPKLEPYPTWEMQAAGNCSAFQFVQSMEIDPKGRMWVLDTGRTATMTTEPKQNCPPRLVILDLENNGEVLRSYQFPADITPYNSTYLNDIVLDSTDGVYAYVTDTSADDPGIIVYSLKDNASWKVRHNSMKAEADAFTFMAGPERLHERIHIDGIALSSLDARERFVYYSPKSSFHLYAVPTSVLKNKTKDIDPFVKELGRKSSQTDGMAMSATGVLYFGLLSDDSVAMWDTKEHPSFTTGQRIITRDHMQMQWPDTFGFDENGQLWCVTNTLRNYLLDKVDPNQSNYRVLKLSTGTKSYQYHENGSEPELPIITEASLINSPSLSAQLDSSSGNEQKLSIFFLALTKNSTNFSMLMLKS